MITKKVKEQFFIISVASITGAVLLHLVNISDDLMTSIASGLFAMYLFYVPVWLLLKIDIVSKILLYLYKPFLFVSALIFVLFFFTEKTKDDFLFFLFFFSLIYPIFLVAKRELKVEKKEDVSVKCVNCSSININPTNNLCMDCGKNLYEKYSDIFTQCAICGMEYEKKEKNCPYCGA